MFRMTIVIGFFCCASSFGMWMRGDSVPVDRLIQNTSKYVARNPDDPQGHFLLARAHSFAFSQENGQVELFKDANRTLPSMAGYESVQVRPPDPAYADTDKARTHLAQSLAQYQRALELDPKNAQCWLGYGWMYEQAAGLAHSSTNPTTQPGNDDPRDKALAAYQKAYDLALQDDLAGKNAGPAADSMVSREAAENMVRLLKTREQTDEVKKQIGDLNESLGALNKIGRAITPIIFSLGGQTNLDDLLAAPDHLVAFDVAGDDVPRRWSWVNAQAGILVWDPDHTGKITSGRQLFGSATWWMFFKNGYEALAALDDDGDGQLEGKELDGIAVWQDANSDGISQPGEVRPATELGIQSIAVKGTSQSAGIQSNSTGIRFIDGRIVASYDWIATSK